MQIRLNSTRLLGKPWTGPAWRYLPFLCKYVFFSWEICSQRQVSLQFHHLVGCYRHKKSWKLSAAKRPNCERSNVPIFTIRVLGAILILLRLFACNFKFGAEVNISARAGVSHVIATKFQPGQPSWNFSPGWNSPSNQALTHLTHYLPEKTILWTGKVLRERPQIWRHSCNVKPGKSNITA